MISFRRPLFALSSALALVIGASGCSVLIPWHPLFENAKLEKVVSLNIEGVAIKVHSFGFVNGYDAPTAFITIKNYTKGLVEYDPNSCELVVKSGALRPTGRDLALFGLGPRRKKALEVKFDYSLKEQTIIQTEYGECHPPAESQVRLSLGQMRIGGRIVQLPSIEYADNRCTAVHFL